MDKTKMSLDEFLAEWYSDSQCMTVHTSGSTGKPKPVVVEKARMEASARMTCRFLGLTPEDTALLCMPLDFIAGKMMAVRSIVGGMKLISVEPSGHPLSSLSEPPSFAAMVPVQVYNSLQVPREAELLRGIRNLIIGGGAVDSSLACQLETFPNAVWSTYGMTETLSHIAMRRLNGSERSEYYKPLPGVTVSKAANGCLRIVAPGIFDGMLQTNDIVEFDGSGSLFKVLGRIDNVIDSGGIKIHVEEVESLLRRKLDMEFAVSKVPDRKFGEIVVLAVTEHRNGMSLVDIKSVAESVLPKYWRPKRYCVIGTIPFTATGKIARKKLYCMVCQCSDYL